MTSRTETARASPPRRGTKIQLMLRGADGGRWGLTLSRGMERFIGHYPRIAGLGSGGPLLRYEGLGSAPRR